MSSQEKTSNVKSGKRLAKMTSEWYELLSKNSSLQQLKSDFIKRCVLNSSSLDIRCVEQLLTLVKTGDFITLCIV